MARLQVYRDGAMIMDPLLRLGPTLVGRSDPQAPDPTLLELKGDDISRRHLVLEVERNERGTLSFHMTDHSRCGTTLNDAPLRKGARTPILPGEQIGVPGLQLVITLDDTPHGAGKPTIERHGMDTPEAFGLAGSHPSIEHVRRKIDWYAPGAAPVHLRGESGTGKELVAHAIHKRSGRTGKCVPVNCATLTQEMVRSELFGHVKGSFTGAYQAKVGAFVLADDGTLFLDEVSHLAIDVQATLLRALDSGEVWPLGADAPVKTNARVITATSAPLEAMVERKEFLADLYNRIVTLPIMVPALRDRPGDLEAIIAAIRFAKQLKLRLHADTVELLRYRPWPGNVRQLEGLLQRLAAQYGRRVILPFHLRRDDEDQEQLVARRRSTDTTPSQDAPAALTALDAPALPKRMGRPPGDCDVAAMVRAIDAAGGNLKEAARAMGIPYSTLRDRAIRLGLIRPRPRDPEPEPV